MRRYGSPVRCGFWHGMSRYGTPEVVRYVSLCFAMFRSLLRLGPPALSRRRRSSRLRDVALCRALSRAGDLRRSRPHFQWNGCRVCCVGFALFRIGRDFFREPGTAPLRVTSCRQGRGSSPPLPAVLDRSREGLASEGLSFVGKDPFLQGHQLDFVPGSPSVRTAEV